uniref:Uncharacterized protein n=1 Tax=Tanacetum cinerariifolium TaxID=118510 RepID=A0A6L2JFR4_TANCI|nr:hypothetical protein [Tanacetum cinerariifolium]
MKVSPNQLLHIRSITTQGRSGTIRLHVLQIPQRKPKGLSQLLHIWITLVEKEVKLGHKSILARSPYALIEVLGGLQIIDFGFGQRPTADYVSRSACRKHTDKIDGTHTTHHNPHSTLRTITRCRFEPRLYDQVRTTSVEDHGNHSICFAGLERQG